MTVEEPTMQTSSVSTNELVDEIADLDSDYGSESPESDIELDNRTHPIEANEIDKLNSNAAREQTSADQDADGHDCWTNMRTRTKRTRGTENPDAFIRLNTECD
jgi:hypothetical protein